MNNIWIIVFFVKKYFSIKKFPVKLLKKVFFFNCSGLILLNFLINIFFSVGRLGFFSNSMFNSFSLIVDFCNIVSFCSWILSFSFPELYNITEVDSNFVFLYEIEFDAFGL